jgi:hypothetical protein
MSAADEIPAIRRFRSPADMLDNMTRITAGGKTVHNFCAAVDDMGPESIVVETPLFPRDALTFYTRFNLNTLDLAKEEDKALHERFYNPARGGGQGDYRAGIKEKVENVVDCLTRFPASKRAVLTIPNRSIDHTVDEEAKCLRELHFYTEPVPSGSGAGAGAGAGSRQVSCTGFMRAQAATIVPKNIHFIGEEGRGTGGVCVCVCARAWTGRLVLVGVLATACGWHPSGEGACSISHPSSEPNPTWNTPHLFLQRPPRAGTIMHTVADRLGMPVGSYTHFVTTLVDGRET